MPIIDLQRSLRRLGRIRMGEKKKTEKGKEYPSKISKWRLTSPSADLLAAAAELYGGEVKPWQGAPTEGAQFELYTESETLDILIPPHDMVFSQWYELWSGGGCSRRCDGQVEQLSGDDCSCPLDAEEKMALAKDGRACKPTTRLFVILPRVPDIGMWHLETHGFYAAVEIPGVLEVMSRLSSATGAMVPAHLRIDQRTSKKDGETRHYTVPVIELRGLSAATLLTGEVPAGEIGPATRALPAGSDDTQRTEAQPPASARGSSPRAAGAASARGAQPPTSPTEDGTKASAVAVRAVRSQARSAGLDDSALAALIVATVPGRTSVEDLADVEEANKVLAAIREVKASSGSPVQDSPELATDAQKKRLFAELRRQGITDGDRHAHVSKILGRQLGSFDELTKNDAKVVLNALAEAGPFDDAKAS